MKKLGYSLVYYVHYHFADSSAIQPTPSPLDYVVVVVVGLSTMLPERTIISFGELVAFGFW